MDKSVKSRVLLFSVTVSPPFGHFAVQVVLGCVILTLETLSASLQGYAPSSYTKLSIESATRECRT